MIARIAHRHDRDAGVTLIEQLIAMIVFLIVAAIVTTSIIALLKQQQRVSAQTGNLNTARKIQETLDYEARYADKVTVPNTVPSASGDYYIEWQVENSAAQPDECTQWRLVPSTQTVQSRSWNESFGGSGVTGLTGWTTVATGVKQSGSTAVFSTAATSTVVNQESVTNTYQGHQEITMTFTAIHAPSQTLNQSITITAINSTVGTVVPSNICAEEGRP